MLYEKSTVGLYNNNRTGTDEKILEVIHALSSDLDLPANGPSRRLVILKILLGYVKQESTAEGFTCSINRFHATLNGGRQLHNYNLPYTYILNTDGALNLFFQQVYFEKIDCAQFQKIAVSGFPTEGWHLFSLITAALTYLLQKANIPPYMSYREALNTLLSWISDDILLLEARVEEVKEKEAGGEGVPLSPEDWERHKGTYAAKSSKPPKTDKKEYWSEYTHSLQAAIEHVLKGGRARLYPILFTKFGNFELAIDPSGGNPGLFLVDPQGKPESPPLQEWRSLLHKTVWSLSDGPKV